MRIRRVLFRVDFSTHCATVADAVQALVLRSGAFLALLQTSRGKATDLLREFRKDLWDHVRTEFVMVESADPAAESLHYIDTWKPDLVMLSTSGDPIANSLLHDTRYPVWTAADAAVTQMQKGASRDTCDDIYCVLDLKNPDRDRLLIDWAADYAGIWNARLRLVHAVPGAVVRNQSSPPSAILQRASNRLSNLQGEAKTSFEAVIDADTTTGLIGRAVFDPRSSIVVTARGSQTGSIIRGAPCPVVIV